MGPGMAHDGCFPWLQYPGTPDHTGISPIVEGKSLPKSLIVRVPLFP